MEISFISYILATVVCSYVTYLIWQTQKIRALQKLHGCQLPSSYPLKDPIFGLDLFIRDGHAIINNTYLPDLIERYQKLGRTWSALDFGSVMIASVEPENLRAVWSTNFHDWGVQEVRLQAMMPFAGEGFISMDGSKWEQSINMLKPSFRLSNISNLEPFERCLKKMICQIPTNGSTVDLQVYFSNLYLDTSTTFLFGEPLGILSGNTPAHAEGFLDAFQKGFQGTGLRIALRPFTFLMPNKQWLAACRKVHRFADYYVEKALEYRKEYLDRKANNDSPEYDTRSSILLYKMAETTGDPVFLRDTILQAMMASQETTANLLGNLFYLIAHHPDIQRRLRTEISSLGGNLDYNQLMGMKYLQKVITEALRLHPVLPQLHRHALRDTILPVGGGRDGKAPIFAPKGTKFDTSFYVLHHLPEIWGSDAEEFNPDRWDTMKPKPWEYVPFGGGPRQCLGQIKAMLETSYVVVRMLQEFQNIESRDERPWKGQVKLTVKNAHGCLVSLTPA